MPLKVYTINKGDELHKGIIFIAKIANGSTITLKENKHRNYRFVREDELLSLEQEGMVFVPDAIDTMRKAFGMIRKIKESEKHKGKA